MKRAISFVSLLVLCVGMGLSIAQTTSDTVVAVNTQRISSLESQISHLQGLGETVASMKATVDSDHQLIWTLLVATLLNVLTSVLGQAIPNKKKVQDAGN